MLDRDVVKAIRSSENEQLKTRRGKNKKTTDCSIVRAKNLNSD